MLELEGKEVCCSVRMALIPRFAFFVLLLLPYQCKAMGENCRETECLLLPQNNHVASDKDYASVPLHENKLFPRILSRGLHDTSSTQSRVFSKTDTVLHRVCFWS